ncbi:MAG: DUF3575 domain-containing protein [Polaribacter sp.]
MKKTLLIITLFISSFSYAQQEVKLNIGNALIIKTLEVSYEYYVSDQSSVGVSALYSFEKRTSDFRYNEDKMITPYFRHYFTTDRMWNFFGEAFFGINTGHSEVGDTGAYEKFSDGALGVSVGSKYISRGGLVIDVYGGLGRNLFTSNSPIIVPRVGINVGWGF